MNILKTTQILLAVFILAGCNLKDDLSNCPPSFNTVLTFQYDGDPDNAAAFKDVIDGVSLFVFDGDGHLIQRINDSKHKFGPDNTYKLLLPEVDHTIVCWANATDAYTSFAGEHITSCKLKNPCRQDPGEPLDTDDPLYFGKTQITIVEDETASSSIELEGAHVDVEIYFTGIGTPYDPATYPVVEIEGNVDDYDIMKRRLGKVCELYVPSVGYDSKRGMICSKLNIWPFDNDNDLVVRVTSRNTRTGRDVLHTINLMEYMQEKGIDIENRNEARITMQIVFNELGAAVILPEWEVEDLTPTSH